MRTQPMTGKYKRVVVAAALIAASSSVPALASGIVGTWVMEGGSTTVKIAPCEQLVCGRIVALEKPVDQHGYLKRNKKNPIPALRSRPLVGLTLFRGLTAAGTNKWQAQIYVPDDGRTYNAVLSITGDGMRVQGCVAKVFCRAKRFFRIKQ